MEPTVCEEGSVSGTCESPEASEEEQWIKVQDSLRRRLIVQDDFGWRLPAAAAAGEEFLQYVGGVDVSYSKEDPEIGCGALVVLNLQTLEVVYEDFSIAKLQIPYRPGFLAFREAPILLKVLEKMSSSCLSYYPQLLMVDGNGLLHPRGCGLACHLGILTNLPTIGVGKNLHHVDGLTRLGLRQLVADQSSIEDVITLAGCTGQELGVALRPTLGSEKPIFVSSGHRISLATAVAIVKMTCKYRVPEPIRQADIRSKQHLKKHHLHLN